MVKRVTSFRIVADMAPAGGRKQLFNKRLTGTITDWLGNFGWVTPTVELKKEAGVPEKDAAKHGGKIYLSKADFVGPPQKGIKVEFNLYSDSSGLGAQNAKVAPIAQTAKASSSASSIPAANTGKGAAKGAQQGKGKTQQQQQTGKIAAAAPPTMPPGFKAPTPKAGAPSKPTTDPKQALIDAAKARVAAAKAKAQAASGGKGAATSGKPVQAKGVIKGQFDKPKVPAASEDEKLMQKLKQQFGASSQEAANALKMARLWSGGGKSAGSEQKIGSGAKGGSDAKGKGKSSNQATKLPAEGFLFEEKVTGIVKSWGDAFGMIKADETINHPAAAKKSGLIQCMPDELVGLVRLNVGAAVQFYVSADSSGLTATEVEIKRNAVGGSSSSSAATPGKAGSKGGSSTSSASSAGGKGGKPAQQGQQQQKNSGAVNQASKMMAMARAKHLVAKASAAKKAAEDAAAEAEKAMQEAKSVGESEAPAGKAAGKGKDGGKAGGKGKDGRIPAAGKAAGKGKDNSKASAKGTAPEASAKGTCPKGHRLQMGVHKDAACDVCTKDIEGGSACHVCAACDYCQCKGCFAKAAAPKAWNSGNAPVQKTIEKSKGDTGKGKGKEKGQTKFQPAPKLGGKGGAAPPAGAPPGKLPPNWEEHWSEEHEVPYFWNKITKEARWVKPK